MIVLTPLIISVSSTINRINVDRGTGGCGSSCHSTQTLVLTTNYTGDTIDIAQGSTFDLKLSVIGTPLTTIKGVGFAFWHTSGDSIGIPTMLSSNATGTYMEVDEWNDGVEHYYGNWWRTAGSSSIYSVYRITPSNNVTTEYLYIQTAAKGRLSSAILTFTINVPAVVSDTTPPSVSITAPSNDSYVSGTSVAITGTATDSVPGVLGSSVKAYVTNTT